MKITRAQLIEGIKKKPLLIHSCSMCGYGCAFSFLDNKLGYDTGCYCTNQRGGWRVTKEEDLDFYLDPENGWEENLNRFLERSKCAT